MARNRRVFLLAFVAMAALVPLAGAPSGQTPAGAALEKKTIATRAAGARDLALVPPESVGISSERLRRLDTAMKRLVDENQVAGLVTLLERHGKVAHFASVGRLDAQKAEPLQKDSIFRIASMTKPVTGVAMMMLYLSLIHI